MKRDAHLSMRLPQDIVDELDAEASRLADLSPGMRVTRADVARTWFMSGREVKRNKDEKKVSVGEKKEFARAK